jgi:putative ABC transport system permease protein
VGVTKTLFLSPIGDVVMSRDLFKSYWRRDTINRIFVLVEEGQSLDAVRQRIDASLGDFRDLRVSTMGDYAEWIAGNVRRAFAFLDVMAGIALIVVLIGTGDALAANVRERTREIGTLRALGFSPGRVAEMVLSQALAIGVGGGVLAVLVGMVASYAFVHGILQEILGWNLEVSLNFRSALLAVAFGIGACVIGALAPAVYAARISIVRALRYE